MCWSRGRGQTRDEVQRLKFLWSNKQEVKTIFYQKYAKQDYSGQQRPRLIMFSVERVQKVEVLFVHSLCAQDVKQLNMQKL